MKTLIQRVIWLTLKNGIDLESGTPEDVVASDQETPPPPPAPSCVTATEYPRTGRLIRH